MSCAHGWSLTAADGALIATISLIITNAAAAALAFATHAALPTVETLQPPLTETPARRERQL